MKSFLLKSYPESCSTSNTDQQWCVALGFLRAMVENLSSNMEMWLLRPGVTRAKLLIFSITQQFSRHPLSRQLGVDLANALVSIRNGPLDPGKALPDSSHLSPCVYVESVLRYSGALSGSHVDLTQELLEESVHFIGVLNSDSRCLLMQCLLPWIRNFGALLSGEYVECIGLFTSNRCSALLRKLRYAYFFVDLVVLAIRCCYSVLKHLACTIFVFSGLYLFSVFILFVF